jgi:hypothetical protein
MNDERKNKQTDEFQNDLRALAQAQLDRLWQARLDEAAECRRLMQEPRSGSDEQIFGAE